MGSFEVEPECAVLRSDVAKGEPRITVSGEVVVNHAFFPWPGIPASLGPTQEPPNYRAVRSGRIRLQCILHDFLDLGGEVG